MLMRDLLCHHDGLTVPSKGRKLRYPRQPAWTAIGMSATSPRVEAE